MKLYIIMIIITIIIIRKNWNHVIVFKFKEFGSNSWKHEIEFWLVILNWNDLNHITEY